MPRITHIKISKTLCGMASAAIAANLAAAAANAQEIEVSYGVDVVSNYISKGLTQTDNNPAVQPWVELGYGMAYIGLWASNVQFGGVDDLEYDVYLGIRPEFGNLSLDIGFAQYLYRDDKTDYGDAYIFADYALSDNVSLGAKYYHEVYADFDWLYLSTSFSGLPWDLTLSAGVGSDFGTQGFNEDSIASDIGISRDINENMSWEVRAHYSTIEGARLIGSISIYN